MTIIIINWSIGLMSRVFANGLGDRGLIPGRVIPKTQKMVLDTALLNTQHYKIRITLDYGCQLYFIIIKASQQHRFL